MLIVGLMVGLMLIVGLMVGLMLIVGLGVGLMLIVGLMVGLMLIVGLMVGLMLIVGLMVGLMLIVGLMVGLMLIVGLMVGLMLMLGLIVGLMLGLMLMLGLIVGLMLGLGLMVGLVSVHPVGALIASSIRLTPPVLASTRPLMVAAESTEIDAEARMLPTNSDPLSIVAELPTCQKTSQAEAPLMSTKRVASTEPTVSAEGTWKTNTGSARCSPFRMIGPPLTRRLEEAA